MTDPAAHSNTQSPAVDVSIVIVSYNVRDVLKACLESITRQDAGLTVQTIVVDNASADDSVAMVRDAFPDTLLVESDRNLGFSGANNVGLKHATGRHILLLNPDTQMEPDVLSRMIEYIDANPEVGMLSCKLITADGSLDLACRRSFPSLWDGFCRASGLSKAFPRSRLFARYNLTYLDEDQTCEVEAVNGAFMFVRREALDNVGPLDEDYFMYIEDLDWCYRFRQAGWKIVYHPAATTLHLKGQSANRRSSAMIRELFNSMDLFYRKHYFPRVGALHRLALMSGLALWKRTTLVKNALRKSKRTRP